MAGKRIVIEAPEREENTVQLVGREYLVVSPKSSIAMKLSQQFNRPQDDISKLPEEEQTRIKAERSAEQLEGLHSFVLASFGKKQGKDVLARLEDPDDALDYPQITELIGALFETETTDPPTSPRDS